MHTCKHLATKTHRNIALPPDTITLDVHNLYTCTYKRVRKTIIIKWIKHKKEIKKKILKSWIESSHSHYANAYTQYRYNSFRLIIIMSRQRAFIHKSTLAHRWVSTIMLVCLGFCSFFHYYYFYNILFCLNTFFCCLLCSQTQLDIFSRQSRMKKKGKREILEYPFAPLCNREERENGNILSEDKDTHNVSAVCVVCTATEQILFVIKKKMKKNS